jgi:hypothetical protein
MQIMMLATSTDQYQLPNSFSVDTDGVYFIIDNSANGDFCNIKLTFVGDFEKHSVTLVTAYGRTTTMKQLELYALSSKMTWEKPGGQRKIAIVHFFAVVQFDFCSCAMYFAVVLFV